MRIRWFRRSHRAGLPSYPIIKTLRPRGHTHSRARMRAVLLQEKALVFPPLSALCSKGASADAGMGLGLEARDSGHGTRDSGLGTRGSGLETRDSGLGRPGAGLFAHWHTFSLAQSHITRLITPLSHHPIILLKMHSGRGASHLFPRCSFSTTHVAITSENE